MTIDAYILCTSPRSGSTLMCRLLAQTGLAGRPGSHFHEPSLTAWRGYYGLAENPQIPARDDLAAIFRAAIATGRGDGGVFGLRLQRHSAPFFFDQLAALHPDQSSDRARIEAAFGRTAFLHLTRADKLEQAISYIIADQSGLWHRHADGAELERLSAPAAPAYDAERITRQIAIFERDEADWRRWFQREGIAPLTIGYDDLAADPRSALRAALQGIGFGAEAAAAAADRARPDTAKLSDNTNREWAARFRKDYCG